jgi:GMC oxidoreductase
MESAMNQVLSDHRKNRQDHATTIASNQETLAENLDGQFYFGVCGAGASGSVIADRLAVNRDVKVLLIEAGGSDELELVTDPNVRVRAIGSEHKSISSTVRYKELDASKFRDFWRD